MKHFIPVLTITMLFLMAGLCFGHGDREVAEAKKTGKPLLVVFR